jgi:hypothetical protein
MSTFLETGIFLNRFSFAATFGAGFYKKSKGVSLGSSFNFKSQLEAWYHISTKKQFGCAISHLSHFNNNVISFNFMGTKYNPGQESLIVQFKYIF